jgi:hypothetical protein
MSSADAQGYFKDIKWAAELEIRNLGTNASGDLLRLLELAPVRFYHFAEYKSACVCVRLSGKSVYSFRKPLNRFRERDGGFAGWDERKATKGMRLGMHARPQSIHRGALGQLSGALLLF